MSKKTKPNASKKSWPIDAVNPFKQNQLNHGPQKHNQFNVKNSGMGRRTSRGR